MFIFIIVLFHTLLSFFECNKDFDVPFMSIPFFSWCWQPKCWSTCCSQFIQFDKDSAPFHVKQWTSVLSRYHFPRQSKCYVDLSHVGYSRCDVEYWNLGSSECHLVISLVCTKFYHKVLKMFYFYIWTLCITLSSSYFSRKVWQF